MRILRRLQAYLRGSAGHGGSIRVGGVTDRNARGGVSWSVGPVDLDAKPRRSKLRLLLILERF